MTHDTLLRSMCMAVAEVSWSPVDRIMYKCKENKFLLTVCPTLESDQLTNSTKYQRR